MAIEFAGVRYISRSTHGSATRQAAYIARERITDALTGRVHDFSDGEEPNFCRVLWPERDEEGRAAVATLSNIMELSENRRNSQTAREFVLSLPANQGITDADRIDLTRSFVQSHFIDKGLAAIVAIHKPHPKEKEKTPDLESPAANWHAHVLLSTRYVAGKQIGKKARDLQPQIRRGMRGKSFVAEADRWSAIWRDHQNAYFRDRGMPFQVDPVSIKPARPIGPIRKRGSAKVTCSGV